MPRDILFRCFEIRPTPVQNMVTNRALGLRVMPTLATLAMEHRGELIELVLPEVGP
ncbi:MAG: hypothetical protein IH939_03715 [Acidobacteria bacterium]|nr:hypothetical protein [Acidobacteriota bacterium]